MCSVVLKKCCGCLCSCLDDKSSQSEIIESSSLISSSNNSNKRSTATDYATDSNDGGGGTDNRSSNYNSYVYADGPTSGGASNYTKPSKLPSLGGANDSGLSSPSRTVGTRSSFSHSQSSVSSGPAAINTQKGSDLYEAIKKAYKLKDEYDSPTGEFLAEMDKLFMDCQVHLSDLSAANYNVSSAQKEADFIVDELIALRNHWGPQLLPTSVCNAFVRERMHITLGLQSYRIDCAEFFEPVPYYNNQPNTGDLVKIYRFSVYELSRNEVILRYFLERSNLRQLFHVLCYFQPEDSKHGQVHPYGGECPSYWTVRSHMISDVCKRFQLDTIKS